MTRSFPSIVLLLALPGLAAAQVSPPREITAPANVPIVDQLATTGAAAIAQPPIDVLPPPRELTTLVPAIQSPDGSPVAPIHTAPPPPVNLLSGTDSVLTPKESANVAIAKRWIDGGRDRAAPGADGAVIFRFGATMPAVVCSPLYVCDIALQGGEVIADAKSVQVGDPIRWKVTPTLSGSGDGQVVHVTVKPSDIGLSTNLLVATDRRTYNVKLISRKEDWMPTIAFSYPEDEAAQWAAVAHEQAKRKAATVLPDTGQSVTALDFGYRVDGDKPAWRPLRVYSDGLKTYVQFPKAVSTSEMPALVALGEDDKEQMVNYRVAGDRFVVDKVLARAVLVSGVGRHQVKVTIDRREEH